MLKVKRALISVSDKTGLAEFAKGLKKFNIEIISTGGTAKLLRNSGLSVKEVSDYIANSPGGSGAVREVIELILKEQDLWNKLVQDLTND